MATPKKPKTFKKITQVENAKVTIEVEQTGENEEITEATGAIAQANAKIQEENEEKVTQSIKDEVNGANDDEDSEDDESKEESDIEEEETEDKKSSDAKANDDKEDKENIIEETGGMSWKRIFLFAFLAGCIGIFIVGLLMFVNRNFELSKKTDSNKKIELPKESPTPSPEEVALDAYEIEVLNGSGISGEAANVEGILEDAGFTVSGIGNADNQSYTNTVIAAKDDVKQGFIDELQKTLEERGPVEVIKLSDTGDSDVVVTVGSDLKEEASPTPDN